MLFYLERYSINMKIVNSLLENALTVLSFLATEARSMRLTEVATRLDLPPSGVHRLLSVLCGLGWVEQDPETDFYRLSMKLPVLGHRFLVGARIPDVCQPVLDRLAKQSRELVRLAVLENENLTTIGHAQGAQGSLICQSRAFPTLPLHVTASGKAWLATLPTEEALRLVLSAGFSKSREFGPKAISTADALMKELVLTARRGFGLAVEEAEPGVSSVATAITLDDGRVVGAIAIVAPAFRLQGKRIRELAELAQSGAAELAEVWPLRALASGELRAPRLAAS
jgi:IclR family acetate operon transcriptional repressor